MQLTAQVNGDANEVIIRSAVEADLPELQRVFRAAALSNAGDAPGLLAHPEYLVFTGDGIADGRTRLAIVVSVSGDRLAGFATLTRGPDGQPDLEDLFVDPECRRRGIARRLVQDAASIARRAGHRTITVTGNQHALDFYLAVGFVPIGHADTALGPAPRLRLDLTDPPRPARAPLSHPHSP
jgi:GNAT superfamily N-acetyltransferase